MSTECRIVETTSSDQNSQDKCSSVLNATRDTTVVMMKSKLKLHIKMKTAQKIVLTFVLSSACILVYQYQLSRDGLLSQAAVAGAPNDAVPEEVLHLKLLSSKKQQRIQQQPQLQQEGNSIMLLTSTTTYPKNSKITTTSSTTTTNNNNTKNPTLLDTETNNKNLESLDELNLKIRRSSDKCTCNESTLSAGTQGHVIMFYFFSLRISFVQSFFVLSVMYMGKAHSQKRSQTHVSLLLLYFLFISHLI